MATSPTTRDLLEEAEKHAKRQIAMNEQSLRAAARDLEAAKEGARDAYGNRRSYWAGKIRNAQQRTRSLTFANEYAARIAEALRAAIETPDWALADASVDQLDGLRDLLSHLELNATAGRASVAVASMMKRAGYRVAHRSEREVEQEVAWNLRVRDALRALLATRPRRTT